MELRQSLKLESLFPVKVVFGDLNINTCLSPKITSYPGKSFWGGLGDIRFFFKGACFEVCLSIVDTTCYVINDNCFISEFPNRL